MPYELRKENDKWCVYNKDTEENRGCSDSEEMGKRHMAALYVHEKKSGAVLLSMTITKTSKMDSGRTRWRARANTGEVDLQGERFDVSFWRDLVNNFYKVKEAISKNEVATNSRGVPLPYPIGEIAHYCFYLQDRNKSRFGWPENVWMEGPEFWSEGYFDETPIGKLAAKAAALPEGDRPAISVGVWPDWSKTATEDGVFVYRGGEDVAYLDHLAMTRYPVNQGTEIGVDMETKSVTIAQDALQVLGQDGEEEVKKLEAARLASKSEAIPEGAVIKTDDDKSEVAAAEPVAEPEPKPEVKMEKVEPEKKSEPLPDLAEMKTTLVALVEAMNAVNGVAKALTELSAKVDKQAKELQAIKVTDEAKVKSALDGGGIWGALNLYSPRNDKTNVVKSEEVKGPQVTEQPQGGIWDMMAKPESKPKS